MADSAEQEPAVSITEPTFVEPTSSRPSPTAVLLRHAQAVFDGLKLVPPKTVLSAMLAIGACWALFLQASWLGRMEKSLADVRHELALTQPTPTADSSVMSPTNSTTDYSLGTEKPDFALYTSGGRVIPGLTSPSHFFTINDFSPPPNLFWALRFTREETPWPSGPAMAIHHETWPGYCWAFSGTSGRLGVLLAKPIFVQSVTVEHIPAPLHWDRTPAPRRMELWGLLEARNAAVVPVSVPDTVTINNRRTPSGDDFPLVLMARFEYDINASASIQTFSVDIAVQSLPVKFSAVTLEVLDNWGHREYTCLYRMRVHGSLER